MHKYDGTIVLLPHEAKLTVLLPYEAKKRLPSLWTGHEPKFRRGFRLGCVFVVMGMGRSGS